MAESKAHAAVPQHESETLPVSQYSEAMVDMEEALSDLKTLFKRDGT